MSKRNVNKDLEQALAAQLPIIVKKPEPSCAVVEPVKIDKPARINKAEIARAIFAETLGLERKVIIERMVNEAGLTKAGANTYLANFRRDSGTR